MPFYFPGNFRKKSGFVHFGCVHTLFLFGNRLSGLFCCSKVINFCGGNTTLLSYISPAICLGVFGASFYTPLLMDALEHGLNEDYAFYARCRGLSEKRLLLCHFFPRAALIGLVPNFLQSIGLALANATVIESIFQFRDLVI